MELIWIVAAFLTGLLAKSVRLPTMVGYLGAGLVLALVGVRSNSLIEMIADLGVVLLLFTVGLHINLQSLFQRQVLGVGSIHLILSTLFFTPLLMALGLPLMPAVLVAVALGFSSTVLTAKTLDERRELDSYHGRLAIGILILQDVVAILLLAVGGGEMPSVWALALLALPFLRPLLLKLLYAAGREELLLVYGLLLALGAGWLFEQVGLDAKLGALLIGMVLAGDPRSDELYDKLWALKEVFLVAFFLQVGLAGVPEGGGWLILGILLLLLPLKGLLFFALLLRFDLRARTAFLTGIALTAYSEFALIVVVGAEETGLLDERYVAIVGLAVALSYALNAPLSRSVYKLWRRFEPQLNRFERNVSHPDHEPRTLGASSHVVLGMGRAGTAAYDYLRGQGMVPVGLDSDPAQLQRHLQAGRRVIYGDASDPELWTGLDLSGVEGVLLTPRSAKADARAAMNLRAEGYDGFITALAEFPEDREILQAAGVSVSFIPIAQAGRELAQACLGQETGPVD